MAAGARYRRPVRDDDSVAGLAAGAVGSADASKLFLLGKPQLVLKNSHANQQPWTANFCAPPSASQQDHGIVYW